MTHRDAESDFGLGGEDYLDRAPLELAPDPAMVAGRRILITGAGGSIGRALLAQIAPLGAGRIGLLDHNDSTLYEAHRAHPETEAFLGSITDRNFLKAVLDRFIPEVVLHCAGYKIVLLVETQVIESCKTNVLATHSLAEAAATKGVRDFVFVSSYEAHEPRNVFGETKRVAELFLAKVAAQYPETHFASIRFSLVLNSTGSASVRFEQLAKAGKTLTVTHPEAERYVCTLAEAARSTLCSVRLGASGGVITLAAGEPMKVLEIAHRINEKYRNSAGTVITGERPGEKILESRLDTADLKPSRVPGLLLTSVTPWREHVHAESAQRLIHALAEYAPNEASAALHQLSALA